MYYNLPLFNELAFYISIKLFKYLSITFVQNHALSANEELMLKSKSEATYVLSS